MAKAPRLWSPPVLKTPQRPCSLIGPLQAAGGLDSPLVGTRLVDFETFIGWRATPKHFCFVKVSRR